jgi:hypothetical protein
MDNASGSADRNAARPVLLLLLGGLLIGLAASLPLAVGWPDAMRPSVGVCLFGTEAEPFERIWIRGRIIPLPCLPTFLFTRPAVWGGFLGAGVLFGLIARERAGRGSRGLAAALGGLSLLLLSYLGMVFVPRLTALALPPVLSNGVAEPFALMIFGIVFPLALAIGLALRTPGVLWRAFAAAAATALCYWLVIWFFLGPAVRIWDPDPAPPPFAHRLPAPGNGMGPMMTTVLVANLVAGTIGGWVTLALLTFRRSPVRGRREGQVLAAGTTGKAPSDYLT